MREDTEKKFSPKQLHQKAYLWDDLKSRDECCKVPTPLIRAENLSISYSGHMAFDGLNLTINKGCVTALVGPSGCGKTSFLMSLNRLLEMQAGAEVKGQLSMNDDNILCPKLNLLEHRKQVGMIFQKPQVFPMSIRKNILLALEEHKIGTKSEREELVTTSLKEVGLWDEVCDRLDSSALALSGGQQQRLCFARALVLRPKILLLDEPCSALDPISSGVIEDLILKLRGQYTIIVVTHNLAQARRISDYTAVFWSQDGQGKLLESGRTKEIFENPSHELTAAYVGGMRG